ncbi:hypothetical protein IEN85_04280 [Pelagicoccus sp. NFK12]|uniref:Uncharacterized protein n=1 Tax=Pelagicoccus enzymogenes TaxID=2773457 RepID=A0A927IG24_9BACT|nr:hypothetical protein [Pelagicoccus enzymogenes]MBD5778696.1 hypothetical protein [Pelagicoccus enzymogenes]
MAIIDSYRKSAFLQNESGHHLDAWRNPSYWKSVQSQSGANRPPKGWSHFVLEPPERALDYLDWLNHRHPNKPYLVRRLLHPTWLLASILEAVASQQITRILNYNQVQSVDISAYAKQAMAWKRDLEFLLERSAWSLSLMRAMRLNSEWLRAREKLIQQTIEAKAREAGSVPEPVEVRARPWDRPGVGTWNARKTLRKLLDLHEKADNELSIALTDFGSQSAPIKIPLAKRPLPNADPRIDKGHYLFAEANQAIAYLKWLNHRHPKWPYLLRRLFLPILELTRMVEAIANHQLTQLEQVPALSSKVGKSYTAKAQTWKNSIQDCTRKPAASIPLMRAIRLNCEWLKCRQEQIDASASGAAREAGPVEVRAVPWKRTDGKPKANDAVFRELLALQLSVDKQLQSLSAQTHP